MTLPRNSPPKSVMFSTLGAREHYAPAILAQRAGCLGSLVTDLWNPCGRSSLRMASVLGIDLVDRAVGRYSAEIPRHKVHALTSLGLRYKVLRSRVTGRRDLYAVFEEIGSEFAREACKFLTEGNDAFFGFTSASLETLQKAVRVGARAVLDQIDPSKAEYDLIAQEQLRFPDLIDPLGAPPASYFTRIAQEWQTADAILVNSDWSKRLLIDQEVPEAKIFVAPLPFEITRPPAPRAAPRAPLRVLWLGTLCARKGILYALEATRRLIGQPVRFTFAGPLQGLSKSIRFPDNSRFVGAVPRSETRRLYEDHDVFLFPTLSDGFGLTQLEAIAYGLPVITTRCCGDVVRDGVCGFLVEPRDPNGIVESILHLLDEPGRLERMSHAAIKRSKDFHPNAIWPQYAHALASSHEQRLDP